MMGASDRELLEFACQGQCVLFSQDTDFLRLHAGGIEHAGIIYAHRQSSIGHIMRGLMLIYELMEPADMANHVEFI